MHLKTKIEPGKLPIKHSSFEPPLSPVDAIVKKGQRPASEGTTRTQDSTPQQIVNLQAKQVELSAQFVSQQRASTLPSQELPVFSGNYLDDYPTFIAAFNSRR